MYLYIYMYIYIYIYTNTYISYDIIIYSLSTYQSFVLLFYRKHIFPTSFPNRFPNSFPTVSRTPSTACRGAPDPMASCATIRHAGRHNEHHDARCDERYDDNISYVYMKNIRSSILYLCI